MSENDDLKMYANWIQSEITRLSSYHDHKETMAWVATALYVPLIASAGIYLGPLILSNTIKQIAFTVGALFLTIFIWMFINMQFTYRWYTAGKVKGAMRALANLLAGKVKLDDQNKEPVIKEEDLVETYPQFLYTEIKGFKADRVENLRKLISFKRVGKTKNLVWELDTRWRTELASYLIIFIAFVTVILCIWF